MVSIKRTSKSIKNSIKNQSAKPKTKRICPLKLKAHHYKVTFSSLKSTIKIMAGYSLIDNLVISNIASMFWLKMSLNKMMSLMLSKPLRRPKFKRKE